MRQFFVKLALLLTLFLTVVVSCKKDSNSNDNTPHISVTVDGQTITWDSDLYGMTDTVSMFTRIQSNNVTGQLLLIFSDIQLNPNWLNEINNTEYEITGKGFPHFTILELHEPFGDTSVGRYNSLNGSIKVSKVENEKVYLTFTSEMEHYMTDEKITITGEVNGVSYITQ